MRGCGTRAAFELPNWQPRDFNMLKRREGMIEEEKCPYVAAEKKTCWKRAHPEIFCWEGDDGGSLAP